MSLFKKAERKQVKLKLAITGPTGSGKTYSALRLASGMGKKIAFIDTENGSASLYADKFNFDVLDIIPPFTIEKYTQAIEAAEKAGYEVIVIDSLSHAWAGEGGLLEQKGNLDARPNANHWTNWNPITKKDNAFKNAFLHSSCHIIATMRSKMEYAQGVDSSGKKKIEKLGLAPVQRDGIEYEFTIVFDVAMDHKAVASKDRTGMFVDDVFQVSEETGKKIIQWMLSGKEVAHERKPLINSAPTFENTKAATYPENIFSGDYIIPIGGKFKGMKLADCPIDELVNYASQLEQAARASGKITKLTKEFIDKVGDFVKEGDLPKFDETEDFQ